MKTNATRKPKAIKRVIIHPESYDLLCNLPYNRTINQQNTCKLMHSVITHGQTRDIIVVQKSDGYYYIIDGQHLSCALKNLNRPIECRVVDCKTDEDIVQLMIDVNNIAKKWNFENYVFSWMESGKKDYEILYHAIKKEYKGKIQVSVIPMVYLQLQSRSTADKVVKNGNFVIKDRVKSEYILKCVIDTHRFLPSTRTVNEMLVRLILMKGEGYNHNRMYRNLANESEKGIDFTYLSEEGIYNKLKKIYKK
jgi:hypothetical protein